VFGYFDTNGSVLLPVGQDAMQAVSRQVKHTRTTQDAVEAAAWCRRESAPAYGHAESQERTLAPGNGRDKLLVIGSWDLIA
jgi:hypothetical protein